MAHYPQSESIPDTPSEDINYEENGGTPDTNAYLMTPGEISKDIDKIQDDIEYDQEELFNLALGKGYVLSEEEDNNIRSLFSIPGFTTLYPEQKDNSLKNTTIYAKDETESMEDNDDNIINKKIEATSYFDKILEEPQQYMESVCKESGIIPIIQNIVATVNVGCPQNLKSIAMQARNAEYNPKRFVAVIMRIRKPKATALVFQSGKIVVTGSKNEYESRLAASKFCRILQRLGYSHIRFMDFTIQNIVGSADVRFPIKLEHLCNDNSFYASYEPELFPGLVYRMPDPKVVLLVFVSGKIVITGAQDRTQIYKAFENLYPLILKCKKDTSKNSSLNSRNVEPARRWL